MRADVGQAAERVLRQSVARDRENPFAWYQLGMLYERKGDTARAALATAERSSMTGDIGRALASGQAAMAALPQGSPDWIRVSTSASLASSNLAGMLGSYPVSTSSWVSRRIFGQKPRSRSLG